MINIKIIQGIHNGKSWQFKSERISIGRGSSNTLVLDDYHLSTNHGIVEVVGQKIFYQDLRSTNGSRVYRQDQTIVVDKRNHWKQCLEAGDQIRLGDIHSPVVLIIEQGSQTVNESVKDISESQVTANESILSSRSLIDVPAVTQRIQNNVDVVGKLYEATSIVSSSVYMEETFESIAKATWSLLSNAHVLSLWLQPSAVATPTLACRLYRPCRGATASKESRQPDIPTGSNFSNKSKEPSKPSQAIAIDTFRLQQATIVTNRDDSHHGPDYSTLALPLWHAGNAFGVLQIDSQKLPHFTEAELEVALVFSTHVGLAIKNCQLVEALQHSRDTLRQENSYFREKNRTVFSGLIASSPSMKPIVTALQNVVTTSATVCILGETGTGKEVVANAIHAYSDRKNALFVAQNCAALPATLLESELFGHQKGAFTGADKDKKGLFEIAHKGTLFLDEIGEMPLALQAKLLRVLQEKSIRPIGGNSEKKIDVRIICATHRDIEHEVAQGRFREDLYYRLMVFPIHLPPLRERKQDILPLAEHFLRRYNTEYRRSVAGFSRETISLLNTFSWPGNIRQLQNEIQRLVIQQEENSVVQPEALSLSIRGVKQTIDTAVPVEGSLKQMVEHVEKYLLKNALAQHGNNKTKTAKSLGITREGLHKKLAKFGM